MLRCGVGFTKFLHRFSVASCFRYYSILRFLVGQVFTSGIYYIYIFNEMIEKGFKMTRVFEFLCVLSCRGTSKKGSNITATPEMNSLCLRQYTHMYIHTYITYIQQIRNIQMNTLLLLPPSSLTMSPIVWRDEGADALIGKSSQFDEINNSSNSCIL